MSLIDPVAGGEAVTPNNSADLPGGVTSCLWVGTAGTLKVTTKRGDTLTFVGATGWMPIQAVRVFATGTSADNILALRG